MHIRYDLKKIDLTKFKAQSSFFLSKEDCVFSFYVNDFAIIFEVNNLARAQELPEKYGIRFTISELISPAPGQSDMVYKSISPYTDPRVRDISFINDLYDGESYKTTKDSKAEAIDFVCFMLNCVRKIKSLTSFL